MVETMDRVCSPGSKGFSDLCIKPIAFAQVAEDVVREINYWANHGFTSHYRQIGRAHV